MFRDAYSKTHPDGESCYDELAAKTFPFPKEGKGSQGKVLP